jgi:glycosyltransferase involved in cell wall biosynthesis
MLRMNILLIIDHFGSGGAQRQIVELARGLKKRGHAVEMFIYFPEHDFFRPRIEESRIPVHEYRKGRGFSVGVVSRLSALMRDGRFDVVVSYLSSANIYAEFAKLVSNGPALVVSERTSYHDDKQMFSAFARRVMHACADHVVANSHNQTDWLRRKWWLRSKVSCIYNGVDLDLYSGAARQAPESYRHMQLLAIGRVGPEKNVVNVIRALALLYEEFGDAPRVSWVGGQDASHAGQAYCTRVDRLLEDLPEVRKRWRWLGRQSDIPRLLREHDALIHASLYEGLPNVVCEALACGVPVLVSNVCDHPVLVADGERGFLFESTRPQSIAAAIGRLAQLDADRWRSLSDNARSFAETHLGVEKMVSAYEELFATLIHKRNCWVTQSR